MINLSDLQLNQKAIVLKVNCKDELKQRFYSFGLIKGASVLVEKISLAKNTIALLVDDTNIALRLEEAKQIEVEKI